MLHARQRQTPIISSLTLAAGVWLLVSPLLVHYTRAAGSISNVIAAICVMIISSIRAAGYYRAAWLGWLNALLGLWILVAPWLLGFEPVLGNILVGLLVLVLAGTSAAATGYSGRHLRPQL